MVTVTMMLLMSLVSQLSPMRACFYLCRAARGNTRAVKHLHLHGCNMIASNSAVSTIHLKFMVMFCESKSSNVFYFSYFMLRIVCGRDVDVDHYSAQYLSRSS